MTVEKVLHVSTPHAVMDEVLEQFPTGFENGFWLSIDWLDLTTATETAKYIDSIDNPENLDIFLDWSW